MIYPLIDFPADMGEPAMEALLALETRTIEDAAGEAWELTCFEVVWQKFDYLTNRAMFGDVAYPPHELLEEALEYERGRETFYDLDFSFTYFVSEHYENIRRGLAEGEKGR